MTPDTKRAGSKLVLSLADYSGAWSRPYVEDGYRVIRVDTGHPPGVSIAEDGATLIGADVRGYMPDETPWAVLAAPPCTCFCRPAALRWPDQDASGRTAESLDIVRACLTIAKTATGWWALENPPGRLPRLLPEIGPPRMSFNPCDYGDPWTKQTYLWGTFSPFLVRHPVATEHRKRGSARVRGKTDRLSSGDRARSETPAGFSRAFFHANR